MAFYMMHPSDVWAKCVHCDFACQVDSSYGGGAHAGHMPCIPDTLKGVPLMWNARHDCSRQKLQTVEQSGVVLRGSMVVGCRPLPQRVNGKIPCWLLSLWTCGLWECWPMRSLRGEQIRLSLSSRACSGLPVVHMNHPVGFHH